MRQGLSAPWREAVKNLMASSGVDTFNVFLSCFPSPLGRNPIWEHSIQFLLFRAAVLHAQ